MTKTQTLAAALLATLFGAPAGAHGDEAGPWRRIDPSGAVRGLDGQLHQARCSGYPGTDPAFRFWARRGQSKNLVLYFEGGGACWDNLTCSFAIRDGLPAAVPQFFMPAVPQGTDPSTFNGLFKADPANPVRDWSMVYIPYCTGDLHAGSSERSYQNVGHPVLPLPSTFTLQHRGFDNFMVVMDWVKKNLDTPQRVLVAGSSAGGYGAGFNFPWVAKAWPGASLSVFVDASQGVTTPGWDAGTPGRGSWNLQLAPWVLKGTPLASVRGADLLVRAAQAHPRARVAQFTTTADAVQIGFYGLMKANYGPGGACPSPAGDWYQQMSAKLKSNAASLPNYRHYLALGSYHTALRSPLFFTESSAGLPLSAWLAAQLNQRGHDDEGRDDDHDAAAPWANLACPTCLVDLACP